MSYDAALTLLGTVVGSGIGTAIVGELMRRRTEQMLNRLQARAEYLISLRAEQLGPLRNLVTGLNKASSNYRSWVIHLRHDLTPFADYPPFIDHLDRVQAHFDSLPGLLPRNLDGEVRILLHRVPWISRALLAVTLFSQASAALKNRDEKARASDEEFKASRLEAIDQDISEFEGRVYQLEEQLRALTESAPEFPAEGERSGA
jgi:hypothetical protein